MSDTPARDALIVTVANIDQLTSDPNVAARLALALALDMAQGELVAALIESGWAEAVPGVWHVTEWGPDGLPLDGGVTVAENQQGDLCDGDEVWVIPKEATDG